MKKGASTKKRIVAAALEVCRREGFLAATRNQIAEEAECAAGLVYRYFESMDALRNHVVRHAVDRRAYRVVGEALAARHPAALALPQHFREQAAKALANA